MPRARTPPSMTPKPPRLTGICITERYLSPQNTEISGEGRAILAIADFVRFISLLSGPSLRAKESSNSEMTPSAVAASRVRSHEPVAQGLP